MDRMKSSRDAGHEWKRDRVVPVVSMVESIIGCKWSVRMLWLIADSINRPSAILRACPGLSAKVMNERLRKMMRYGIVQRAVYGEKPPLQVKYNLMPFGCRFMGILKEVRRLQADVDNQSISALGETKGILYPCADKQSERHGGDVHHADA